MARLHEVCVSPKWWKTFPNGSHNDTWIELEYFQNIMEFIVAVIRNELVTTMSETGSL
jgi:myo-inositol catabolism protein IolC